MKFFLPIQQYVACVVKLSSSQSAELILAGTISTDEFSISVNMTLFVHVCGLARLDSFYHLWTSLSLIMTALRRRCGHYIFILRFLLFTCHLFFLA